MTAPRTVLVANPSSDVYGSDLQLLESISAFVAHGDRVVVAMPAPGPLVERIRERGGEVGYVSFPVVRRVDASALGMVRLAVAAARAIPRLARRIRGISADVVYVNTVTIPWWIFAARVTRTPVVCHVHEAETTDGWIVRRLLNGPLLLADRVIAISKATVHATSDGIGRLSRRMQLIYNGVPAPLHETHLRPLSHPTRLAVVSRLSPRKAPHVAMEATALLRDRGRDVELLVYGTPFDGYEWYETELRERAAEPALAGSVSFLGYQRPIWNALERADIVVAPSLREPFGNAVVEAQLARRPVVASAALGHLETIDHGRTGILVDPDDAEALAAGVERLLDDPELTSSITDRAAAAAVNRFGVERYQREIIDLVDAVIRDSHAG